MSSSSPSPRTPDEANPADTRAEERSIPRYGQYAPQPPVTAFSGGQPQFFPGGNAVQPPTSRPTLVSVAFWLFLVAALLWLGAAILSALWFNSDAAKEALLTWLRNNEGDLEGYSAEQAAAVGTAMGTALSLIAGIIPFVLFPIFAIFFYRGKNWARICATIFAILALSGLVLASAAMVLGLVALALGVVAVVFLYVGESGPYFQRSASRL